MRGVTSDVAPDGGRPTTARKGYGHRAFESDRTVPKIEGERAHV